MTDKDTTEAESRAEDAKLKVITTVTIHAARVVYYKFSALVRLLSLCL